MPTQGTKMFLLQQRLKHIKLRLKEWNKNEFGNIFKARREVEFFFTRNQPNSHHRKLHRGKENASALSSRRMGQQMPAGGNLLETEIKSAMD